MHNVRKVALAWLLAKPEMSNVITDVTKTWHVRSNVRALDLQLSPADRVVIDGMTADNPWLI